MNGDTGHNQGREIGHKLLSFPVPESRLVSMPQPAVTVTSRQPVLSLKSVAHGLANGMLLGIPAGLLWGCFLESLWISSESVSISLLSYYSFWALLGASFGVALLGTRSLKAELSAEPELSEIWSRANLERKAFNEFSESGEPGKRWAA